METVLDSHSRQKSLRDCVATPQVTYEENGIILLEKPFLRIFLPNFLSLKTRRSIQAGKSVKTLARTRKVESSPDLIVWKD